jgi:hypothetical protein
MMRVLSLFLLIVVPVSLAQDRAETPTKTAREIELETALESCQVELAALKAPPTLNADYVEAIDALQQQIQAVGSE